MGVQGLADGFLAGFNTADQAISRNREQGLRDVMLKQQVKDADRRHGLAREQMDWHKQTDKRDHRYKIERNERADQQWEKNHGLAQASQRVANANLGLRTQEFNLRRATQQFQRAEAARQQRMQEEMPVVQALYHQIETAGQVDPQLYSQISPDNPLHPARFFGQTAIDNVMAINQLMPKVLSGDISYNDPQVLTVMNTVLAPHIRRNIGEVDPQTGNSIKDKSLAHVGISEDGQSVILSLKVTYSDGTTADKPLTRYGSADKTDDEVVRIPLARVMDELRGYGQMVGQLNQPDKASFISSMVNPPDKTAMRQETADYRQAILDIGKNESKQLAALYKDSAMMDEKLLAIAREDIIAQAGQRRQQAAQLFGQGGPEPTTEERAEWETFTQEYQQKVGAMPDMNNPQDQQFFMQWKQDRQQREASTPPDQVKTPERDTVSDSQTAQQLREIYSRVKR
ncbi:TPA: hypothetical protein ACPZQZ_001947 [Yersinia enterocolitica]|uniref:hypothetical protein n=1 Tax=Yersinia enterocolitica TaxID=630 RepID=UPI000313DCE5|nr:hypothetical protein [Yersinia enterocolitica]